MKNLLFVCLGNICRSPLAEGVMESLTKAQGIACRIDSAGTSAYHSGEKADRRMRNTAESHNINLSSRSRQIHREDGEKFDYIFAMDQNNYKQILNIIPTEYQNKVHLFRDFDPDITAAADVPDPYYGGQDGFENVFSIVYRTCRNMLKELDWE
ncbi:low molecular weight protein-tyrosine-phosphatase [Spirochaeta cellobiosiphila]|uniref:low molecular weight protein-tyrosine-phosphatase n=1 Tax=Spirochaeta cellobiosiphila TaxID=504483 RepID=UPI00041EA1F9|nr:low molecular weight protein-tyrosine-phosphatase [Spirochaeta cellobiosiphila]